MSNQIEAFVVAGGSSSRDVDPLTGAQRDNQEGKIRYDLIGTHLLTRLGAHVTKGAKKYTERNWEKGQRVSRTWASLWRHVIAYQQGERTEDHLAAIAFNVMSIMHVEEEVLAGRLPAALLDIGFYQDLEMFAAAFKEPTWSEQVVLDVLDEMIDGYSASWVTFERLKAEAFPSITDEAFSKLMGSLITKEFIAYRIDGNRVRPSYALKQQVELHEGEQSQEEVDDFYEDDDDPLFDCDDFYDPDVEGSGC